MSPRTLTALLCAAALAALAIWYARRDGDQPPATHSKASPAPRDADRARTPPVPASAAADPAAPEQRPRARRTNDPARREHLLDAIQRARSSRRTAAHGSRTPASAGGGQQAPQRAHDAEYVKESVRDIVPLLRECYEQALERAPTLEGTVVVSFTIEGEPEIGGVIGTSEIEDEQTTIDDAELRECMRETMYAIEIDPPSAGGTTSVTYPFEFRTSPPEDR